MQWSWRPRKEQREEGGAVGAPQSHQARRWRLWVYPKVVRPEDGGCGCTPESSGQKMGAVGAPQSCEARRWGLWGAWAAR